MLYKISDTVFNWIMNISKLTVTMSKPFELRLDQGHIFVFNHYSRIETVIIAHLLHEMTGRKVVFIVDAEIFKNKWINPYLKRIGGISSDDPDKYRKFSEAVLDGNVVMCFPQGQMDRKMVGLPVRRGSAVLAMNVAECGMTVNIVPGKVRFSRIDNKKNWLSRMFGLGHYMTIESNFMLRDTIMTIDYGHAIVVKGSENPLQLHEALNKRFHVDDVVNEISNYLLG